MKKLLLLLGVGGMMVACGGEQKKNNDEAFTMDDLYVDTYEDDSYDEIYDESTEVESNDEDYSYNSLIEYAEAMVKAAQEGRWEDHDKINLAKFAFENTLSESELDQQIDDRQEWFHENAALWREYANLSDQRRKDMWK